MGNSGHSDIQDNRIVQDLNNLHFTGEQVKLFYVHVMHARRVEIIWTTIDIQFCFAHSTLATSVMVTNAASGLEGLVNKFTWTRSGRFHFMKPENA